MAMPSSVDAKATAEIEDQVAEETPARCGTGAKVCGGCCGLLVFYVAFMVVPLALWNSDLMVPADDTAIPEAAGLLQHALDVLGEQDLDMAISLISPDGAYVGKQATDGAPFIGWGAAYRKFTFLQRRAWDTEQVCGGTDRLCYLPSMLTMGFTGEFSCQGAVVLRDGGEVVGVLALSGGAPAEDGEVAALAAERAGYVADATKPATYDYPARREAIVEV